LNHLALLELQYAVKSMQAGISDKARESRPMPRGARPSGSNRARHLNRTNAARHRKKKFT
jgi:hypothetical protein